MDILLWMEGFSVQLAKSVLRQRSFLVPVFSSRRDSLIVQSSDLHYHLTFIFRIRMLSSLCNPHWSGFTHGGKTVGQEEGLKGKNGTVLGVA